MPPWLQLETVYVLEGLGPLLDDGSQEPAGAKYFEDQARARTLNSRALCTLWPGPSVPCSAYIDDPWALVLSHSPPHALLNEPSIFCPHLCLSVHRPLHSARGPVD